LNSIERILVRYNTRSIYLLLLFKKFSILWPVSDILGLEIPGVYRIPCESGAIYIRDMGCMAEGHLKKHQRDFCLYHSECLAVAEYVINQNHRIHFSSTIVLAKLLHESNKVFLKAIEISLHQNFSREGGCHHWPGSPSSKFFRNREDVPVSLNPHI
jgi:hypothetical protein